MIFTLQLQHLHNYTFSTSTSFLNTQHCSSISAFINFQTRWKRLSLRRQPPRCHPGSWSLLRWWWLLPSQGLLSIEFVNVFGIPLANANTGKRQPLSLFISFQPARPWLVRPRRDRTALLQPSHEQCTDILAYVASEEPVCINT